MSGMSRCVTLWCKCDLDMSHFTFRQPRGAGGGGRVGGLGRGIHQGGWLMGGGGASGGGPGGESGPLYGGRGIGEGGGGGEGGSGGDGTGEGSGLPQTRSVKRETPHGVRRPFMTIRTAVPLGNPSAVKSTSFPLAATLLSATLAASVMAQPAVSGSW